MIFINLQSQCGCNTPAQQQSLSYGDVQLIPKGSTELKGGNRTIQLLITPKSNKVSINPHKLKLRFFCASVFDAKLSYNNQLVQGSIPGTALPPIGQPISFQLDPGSNQQVSINFSLYYEGKIMQGLLNFTWTDGSDSQGEAFLNAILDKSKTLAEIEELIKQNAQYINYQDKLGSSPLHYGINKTYFDAARDLEIAKLMLKYGANVNVADNIGNSPLLGSIIYAKNKDLAEFLIQHGAKVDQTDNQGHSPFYWAAYAKNEPLIQLLLANGATVDQADEHGQTPLWNAVFYGDEDIVEVLIKNGADANKANQAGKTPLQLAQEKGFTKIEALLRNAK